MTCPISIFIEQEKEVDSVISQETFESWINEIELELGPGLFEDFSSVSIGLVSKKTIQGLNQTYREKDAPTNVLAFEGGVGLGEELNSLGDIAICPEVLREEALEQSKDESHHFAHLFIHGILHLIGYNHEKTFEAEEMEKLEIRILNRLGIADPYQIDLI